MSVNFTREVRAFFRPLIRVINPLFSSRARLRQIDARQTFSRALSFVVGVHQKPSSSNWRLFCSAKRTALSSHWRMLCCCVLRSLISLQSPKENLPCPNKVPSMHGDTLATVATSLTFKDLPPISLATNLETVASQFTSKLLITGPVATVASPLHLPWQAVFLLWERTVQMCLESL